jgi:hypothetical protein
MEHRRRAQLNELVQDEGVTVASLPQSNKAQRAVLVGTQLTRCVEVSSLRELHAALWSVVSLDSRIGLVRQQLGNTP